MPPVDPTTAMHLTGRNRVSGAAGSSAVPLRNPADPALSRDLRPVIRLLNAVTGKPADHSPEIRNFTGQDMKRVSPHPVRAAAVPVT